MLPKITVLYCTSKREMNEAAAERKGQRPAFGLKR